MPRIRTIKPEFFTHPEILALSIPARLLLLSLLGQADDEGRLYDQPLKIAGQAFGEQDKVNVRRLLSELASNGRIERYTAAGRACIQVSNFANHQSVSHPRPSSIPPGSLPEVSGGAPEPDRPPSGTPPGTLPEASGGEWNGTGNREQGREDPPKPPQAPLTRRDELFETVADVCGIDWHGLTAAARGPLNRAVADLRSAGADPDEIHRRAANWPNLFAPDTTMTPSALAKHWPQLAVSRSSHSKTTNNALQLAAELEARGR